MCPSEIGHRETLGLIGESGCGKSVTAMAIMGLIGAPSGRITRGRITLDGRDLLGLSEREMSDVRGDRVAMVFQEPMTAIDPAFTIGQQLTEVVRRHTRFTRKQARSWAIELLDRVGISDPRKRIDDYPHQLSGRYATAGTDRHGPLVRAGPTHRRRADDGAR